MVFFQIFNYVNDLFEILQDCVSALTCSLSVMLPAVAAALVLCHLFVGVE